MYASQRLLIVATCRLRSTTTSTLSSVWFFQNVLMRKVLTVKRNKQRESAKRGGRGGEEIRN